MIKISSSTDFANKIISLFVEEPKKIVNILKNMTEKLYKISFEDKNFVCGVLNHLFLQREKIPIKFYEEQIKGLQQRVKLYNPGGVLGVVPFTRNLTEATIEQIEKGATDLLDVGCGIGLTNIAAAHKGVNSVALDINLLAVMTTKINAVWNNVSDKIEAVHADFMAYKTNKKFEIIVSNPPIDPIPKSLKRNAHKIYQRLIDGVTDSTSGSFAIDYPTDKEGIALFERILQRAPQLLKKQGILIVADGNIDYDELKSFTETAMKYGYRMVKVSWFANKYSEFQTSYNEKISFTEKTIKRAITDGIEVYEDRQLLRKMSDSSLIKGNDYFFKGFAAVWSRMNIGGNRKSTKLKS